MDRRRSPVDRRRSPFAGGSSVGLSLSVKSLEEMSNSICPPSPPSQSIFGLFKQKVVPQSFKICLEGSVVQFVVERVVRVSLLKILTLMDPLMANLGHLELEEFLETQPLTF